MTFLTLYGSSLDRELGTADRTGLFTTVARKLAINEAARWFVTQTACLIRTGSFAIVDGTSEYDLEAQIVAGDFITLAPKFSPEVWIVKTGQDTQHYAGEMFPRQDVALLNRDIPGWRNSEGYPESWYVRSEGGTELFGVYPTPDIADDETWTAKVPYVAEPAEMTADGDLPFTIGSNALAKLEPWHDALVYYAASELEKLRKGTERSVYFFQRATARVQDYLDKQRLPGGKPVRLARRYREDARRLSGASVYGPYDDPRK